MRLLAYALTLRADQAPGLLDMRHWVLDALQLSVTLNSCISMSAPSLVSPSVYKGGREEGFSGTTGKGRTRVTSENMGVFLPHQ